MWWDDINVFILVYAPYFMPAIIPLRRECSEGEVSGFVLPLRFRHEQELVIDRLKDCLGCKVH